MLARGQLAQHLAKLIKLFENRPFLDLFFCILAGYWTFSTSSCCRIAANSTCGSGLVPMRQTFRQKRPLSRTHRQVYGTPRSILRNYGREIGEKWAVPCRIGEESVLLGCFSAIAAGGGKKPKIMRTFVSSSRWTRGSPIRSTGWESFPGVAPSGLRSK